MNHGDRVANRQPKPEPPAHWIEHWEKTRRELVKQIAAIDQMLEDLRARSTQGGLYRELRTANRAVSLQRTALPAVLPEVWLK